MDCQEDSTACPGTHTGIVLLFLHTARAQSVQQPCRGCLWPTLCFYTRHLKQSDWAAHPTAALLLTLLKPRDFVCGVSFVLSKGCVGEIFIADWGEKLPGKRFTGGNSSPSVLFSMRNEASPQIFAQTKNFAQNHNSYQPRAASWPASTWKKWWSLDVNTKASCLCKSASKVRVCWLSPQSFPSDSPQWGLHANPGDGNPKYLKVPHHKSPGLFSVEH